jgi:hypothetical protein
MLVLGIIALVICLPLLIGGAALAIIFGPDGRFASGDEQLTTPSRALVSAVADISGDSPVDRDLAGVRLELQLTSAKEGALFIGVGRAVDVSRYLAGVNVARVDDIEFGPFRYTTSELPGERVPAPPNSEPFWVEQAEGAGEVELDWRLRTGTYQVVVMNADASPGVDVSGSLAIVIPWIFWVALGLLIVGFVLLVGGILLVVFGAKRRPVTTAPAGTPGAPGRPGQYVPPGPGQPWPQPGAAAPPATTPSGLRPGDPLPPPPPPPG